VTNSLEPLEPPARLWSFNQEDCQGGTLREYYPAAGFRTKAGVTVGLLTDSGYRNHWSRIIRRDGKPVKPALLQIPDVNLNYVRRAGKPTVQQTFGEALVQSENQNASEVISLPAVPLWQKQGEVDLEERDGSTVLSLKSTDAAVLIPFPAKDGEVYSLHLQYRSAQALPCSFWMWTEICTSLKTLRCMTTGFLNRQPDGPSSELLLFLLKTRERRRHLYLHAAIRTR